MSGQMDGYVDSVLFYRSSLMIMRTGKSKLMRSLVGAILLSIGRFFFPPGNVHFCPSGLSSDWVKST